MHQDDIFADVQPFPADAHQEAPEELWLRTHKPGVGSPEDQVVNLAHYLLSIEPQFLQDDTSEPADWRWRSYVVRLRAGWTCEECKRHFGKGQRSRLQAHHLEGREWLDGDDRGPHELWRLISVCKECHEALHGRKFPDRAASDDALEQVFS